MAGAVSDAALPKTNALLPRAVGIRGLLRQGAIVFAGSMALGVCGALFQMIASRKLGVETYGTFYTLLSIVAIAGMPGAILAPVIARYAAEFRALHDDAHVRGLIADLVRWTAVAALAYVVLAFALAAPAAGFLHVPVWTLPVAGVIAAVTLGSGVLRAIAQGTQAFATFAASAATEGVAKVLGLVALILVGLGLIGGLLGYGIGAACGLASVAWLLARHYRSVSVCRVRYDWPRVALSTGGAASITLAMTLMGTVDVILVKHYFNPHAAGLYAAAALGGKVLLFLVGFVPMVLLPRVTDNHARGERTRDALWLSIALLVAVAVIGAIALQYCGPLLLHVLVGRNFDAAAPLLLPYALAMIALGVTNVLACYGIATHRLAFIAPLVVGGILTLAAIALAHSTLTLVVRVLLTGNALTCIGVAGAMLVQAPHRAAEVPAA